MKNAALLLFFLTALTVSAQQSVLNGTVTVFNSQFETGKKQYIANAQVEEDYGKSQATTTNTEGVFKLPLLGIKDLEKVFFNVKKATYEVVNTDALQAVAGQKEAAQVYLALEGVIAENKRKYYQINRTASEKAVTEKLVQLGQQIETLQQNKEANKTKIETVQAEYARLQESFKKIEETARELAERYAKTNLDDASAEYQRAFRYFQRGLLDSALFVFQKMDLEQTAKFVVSEQNRTAALKMEYETRNTEKNKQKVQTTEALLFKANLHQAKFEFSRVEECYGLLLRLDSMNYETNYNYALFLQKQLQYSKIERYYLKALSLTQSNATKANVLNNLGAYYSDNQKMPQAEAAYNEALKVYRQLADKKPDAFLPDMAMTLNNLGNYYSDNQKMPQAEAAYSEALKIYRQLANKNPEAFLPDVAMTLNNLGAYYYTNQKMPQAEAAYNEALKIRRQLADKNPDAFLPNVANTLNNLGNYYSDNQQMPQAEAAYNEALKVYRQLADKNPDAFLPNVAMTLNNLGVFYKDNQQMPQAEAAYNEALKVYRQLAAKNPDAFLPYVATTLNNLGVYYKDNQQMPQAEAAYNEALKVYRQLANKNPDAFLPYVATTLNNLGIYYRDHQQMPQAEAAYNEALKIYRQLAAKNPDAFLPNVATTLNNLGNYYRENQQMPQAEAAYNEALKIRRQLADKNLDAFSPNVATTLNNLGNYYCDNQQMPQAEAAYNEALKIRRQLADKNPDAFSPNVATTLNNLGVFYKTLKNYDTALIHYSEAMQIREAAILRGRVHQLKDWKQVMRNISDVKDSTEVRKDYQNVVKAGQLLAKGCDTLKDMNDKLKPIAVLEYGSLSWNALFVQDYTLSEKAALRCLELDNTQKYVYTNLGHSQLLRGQYAAAKTTYQQLKGKKNDEGKAYKQVILDDFKALEAEGITHKDMPRMKAEIEKW